MRAFTLIEAIIYFALLSILMAVALQASTSFGANAAEAKRSAVIAREGLFVAAKMRYELDHDPSVSFDLDRESGAILLRKGSGEALPLTSANVHAESFLAEPIFDETGTIIGTKITFSLDGVLFSASTFSLL